MGVWERVYHEPRKFAVYQGTNGSEIYFCKTTFWKKDHWLTALSKKGSHRQRSLAGQPLTPSKSSVKYVPSCDKRPCPWLPLGSPPCLSPVISYAQRDDPGNAPAHTLIFDGGTRVGHTLRNTYYFFDEHTAACFSLFSSSSL